VEEPKTKKKNIGKQKKRIFSFPNLPLNSKIEPQTREDWGKKSEDGWASLLLNATCFGWRKEGGK
jgi:hypothetical protein